MYSYIHNIAKLRYMNTAKQNLAQNKCAHRNVSPENWDCLLTNVDRGKTKSWLCRKTWVKVKWSLVDRQLPIKIQLKTTYNESRYDSCWESHSSMKTRSWSNGISKTYKYPPRSNYWLIVMSLRYELLRNRLKRKKCTKSLNTKGQGKMKYSRVGSTHQDLTTDKIW